MGRGCALGCVLWARICLFVKSFSGGRGKGLSGKVAEQPDTEGGGRLLSVEVAPGMLLGQGCC